MTPSTVIDIAEVFQSLYGYVPANVPALPVTGVPENPFKVDAYTKRASKIKGSPLYGLSDTIGRQVFCPVSIKAGNKNYDFAYTTIGLRNKMQLKRTPMIERGGDVIEEIGMGAWEISVKGFLIDPYDQFPDDQLYALGQLYKYRQPINLLCALTDLFLEVDDTVIIADLEIPPKPKVIGVRDFSFTLIQDSILDLYKVE